MKSFITTKQVKVPDFDDIVFAVRNREYGAYVLRRNYRMNVIISLIISTAIMITAVTIPFLRTKAADIRQKNTERQVEIKMLNLDQPAEALAPPPPPPPPVSLANQARYVPPVVVDSVKPEETNALMTADEAQIEVKNEDVVETIAEVHSEVQEEETITEPFIVVEESPEFPGGYIELQKWVAEHLRYPQEASENNIQGRVFVRFCVTATGGIDRISVIKGVDPSLDAEAIRVVKLLPAFKPGKQGGKPVPVWFSLPVKFEIKN